LAGKKALSIADLARACGWAFANGEPYKSKVQRVIARLQADKLVKVIRGRRYRLTDEGRKAAGEDDKTETTIEDRAGAVGSKKAFHALRGMKQRPTVPCAFCGQTGDVYKFADGRQPKGQRHHADLRRLHGGVFHRQGETRAAYNLNPLIIIETRLTKRPEIHKIVPRYVPHFSSGTISLEGSEMKKGNLEQYSLSAISALAERAVAALVPR
jgi:hypothetical protein